MGRLENKTVLYIEDDKNNRELVNRVLSYEGALIFEAANAIEAMDILATKKPDIILMDINMPGMNGYELTTKIKGMDTFSGIPIVAVTVLTGKGDREMAIMSGCVGYISKPIDVDTFSGQIADYISGLKDSLLKGMEAEFICEYNRRLVVRLEEKISEAEQAKTDWEDTFNSITDLILICDYNHNIIKANRPAEERIQFLKGLSKSNICILDLADRTDDDSRCKDCPYKRTMETGNPNSSEEYIECIDGTFLINTYPIKSPDRIVIVFKDISNIVAARKRQEKLLKKISSANNDLTEFAQVVSHDLKTPLRAITILSQMVLRDNVEKIDTDSVDNLNTLVESSKKMYKMIEEILRYSKITIQKSEIEEIQLSPLVTNLISTLTVPYNISIDIKGALPTVRGIEVQFIQIFQNILSNAIKYNDKPEGKITVDCVEKEQHWLFSITDNGKGIAQRDFKKIFNLFETLSRTSEEGSTGVGLSVVKKIIQLYHGDIWLESVPEQSCTFYFSIPQNISFHDFGHSM